MIQNHEQQWLDYCKKELRILTPLLDKAGYILDQQQPHLSGERYLMQAVTTKSGKKLILLGWRKDDNMKVVIKATREPAGMEELLYERRARKLLQEIKFAYETFLSPKELLFKRTGGYLISIQQFIPQESTFLSKDTPVQFTLALRAFKAQESAHATTHSHIKRIRSIFGTLDATGYLRNFKKFEEKVRIDMPADSVLHALLEDALHELDCEQEYIEQYSGFLTHTDFVPHNFRVSHNDIYLLDYSSLRFGNKYEGWARFLNFMTLYNPALEEAIVDYVKNNRTPEESMSLRSMRLYRLGEIISYYTGTLTKSSGDLLLLNRARVEFWTEVLVSQLKNTTISSTVREKYMALRDSLRSTDEVVRQKELH